MNFELAEYQKQAKQHVLDNKACALFMSMGMGKTLTVLDAANDLLKLARSRASSCSRPYACPCLLGLLRSRSGFRVGHTAIYATLNNSSES